MEEPKHQKPSHIGEVIKCTEVPDLQESNLLGEPSNQQEKPYKKKDHPDYHITGSD